MANRDAPACRASTSHCSTVGSTQKRNVVCRDISPVSLPPPTDSNAHQLRHVKTRDDAQVLCDPIRCTVAGVDPINPTPRVRAFARFIGPDHPHGRPPYPSQRWPEYLDAILYVLHTRSAWRHLPHAFTVGWSAAGTSTPGSDVAPAPGPRFSARYAARSCTRSGR